MSIISHLKTVFNSLRSDEFDSNKIEVIRPCFRHFKPLILDAYDIDKKDQAVQEWIRKVKDTLQAADDLLDDIAAHDQHLLIQNNKVRGFSNRIASRFQIHRELEKIYNTFKELVKDENENWFKPKPKTTVSDLDSTNIVGVDETKDKKSLSTLLKAVDQGQRESFIPRDTEIAKVVEMLMEQNGKKNVSLIAIVGVAGIGKTTLALLVFIHAKVIEFFHVKIWVCFSQNFGVHAIVEKILACLSIKTEGEESLKDLLNMLVGALEDKKYLIVFDEACCDEHEGSDMWNQITELMTTLKICGAQGSKILVTTRSQILAKVNVDKSLFHLRSLNHAESLNLLEKWLSRDDYYQKKLIPDSVKKEIVIKCRGVPQLIRIVAIALHGKYKLSEWIDVLETGLRRFDLIKDLSINVLKWYYKKSNFHFKQCYRYLSVYPKGWKIEKNELIQLWMAQGYLEADDKQQMEDVGYKYLEFLNPLLVPDDGTFNKLKILDDVGNIFHHFALITTGNDMYVDSERGNTRMHMSLSQELRTFFPKRANDQEIVHMKGELSDILRFKGLRVLNLSRCYLKKLPGLIGEVKHLRYLDLSWNVKLVSLPKSICKLVHLQTLKLTGCEKLEFSTKAVTKLINLRHLEIHRCKAFQDMMPAGLEKLSSLQSLSNFYVVVDNDQKKKAAKLNELQNLNSLRGNLEISRLDQVRDAKLESHNVNLKDKKLLESLDLIWETQDKKEDSLKLLENLRPHQNLKRLHVRWYPGDKFSSWISYIQHLSHISLFGFNNCESLPPLESLPNLKSLEISSMKELEYIDFEVASHTEATFFPSLEKLKFSGCENFEGWKRLEDDPRVHRLPLPQFRRLSQLTIKKCLMLTYLPTFPTVKELQLCECCVSPLNETLDIASTSSSPPLSKLKSLVINGKLPDLSVLPPQWKQRLTSLESLEIGDVDALDIWFEGSFTSLQKVVVYGCDLKALPKKMCDLLSLHHIKIMGCHNLASLPKEMSQLTKLVTLEIWDCPLLTERCQEGTGEDWPQISHVENKILKQNLRQRRNTM